MDLPSARRTETLSDLDAKPIGCEAVAAVRLLPQLHGRYSAERSDASAKTADKHSGVDHGSLRDRLTA